MKTLLLLITTGLTLQCFSQGSNFRYFSDAEKQELIRNNFTKLITGQNTAAIGSYAALDIEKASVSFSPSFILRNNDIINLKFQGAATDGISAVFTNSKLNNNVSFEFQYHIMLSPKEKEISFAADQADEVYKKRLALAFEIYDLYMDFYIKYGLKDPSGLIVKSSGIIGDIRKLDQVFINPEDIKARIENVNKELSVIDANFNAQLPFDDTNIIRKRYNKLREIVSDKNVKANTGLAEKITITGFTHNWLTLGYKLRNDQFRLLTPATGEISKENFVSHEPFIQYSYYCFNQNGSTFYFAGALAYRYKSNFASLAKKTIEENTALSPGTVTERSATETYTAYMGDYVAGIDEAEFFYDFYYFPEFTTYLGMHVFQNTRFTELQKPKFGLGFGLVVPFKNKKKEPKSLINAEVYYHAKDLSGATSGYDRGAFENGELGIRFALPLNL